MENDFLRKGNSILGPNSFHILDFVHLIVCLVIQELPLH